MADYSDLIERLTRIEEELSDQAYETLTAATLASDSELSRLAQAKERKLLAARRAIAKAIGSLQTLMATNDDSME